MLWTIFVILAVLWLLGMVSSYTMGGAVHLLLVLAVIVLLFNLLGGQGVELVERGWAPRRAPRIPACSATSRRPRRREPS